MEVRPGYKQTGVGVIPEDWDFSKIGDYAFVTKLAGYEYSKFFDYSKSGPIIAIRALNIKGGALNLDDVHTIPQQTSDALPRSQLTKGDLVMSYVGTLGRVAVVPEDDTFHLAPNVAKLTVNRQMVSPEFLSHFLNSAEGQRHILDAAASTTQAALSMRNLRGLFFPRPPLPEQQAIAEAVNDADALIESLARLLIKKRRLKQGAMQELLTGKRRLPGFSGKWGVRCLAAVADTDPENLGGDTRPDYAFNYIALEDVEVGTLNSYSEQLFRTAPSRARRRLRKGDVLVATVRPNLKSHLLFAADSDRWVCSTGFCVVRCREGVSHPGYLFFQMFGAGIARQIEALLTGSNYPAINGGDVRALEIPFPDYEEQSAIAAVLSDMDAEIAALEAKLSKARRLKQGMMQELLTGRIRLV